MSRKLIQAGTPSTSLDTGSPVSGQNVEAPVGDAARTAVQVPASGSILSVAQAKREFIGESYFQDNSPSQ
jgi:hypothetical protein